MLEARLTDSAYHRILPARYLQKDEHGEVVDTPEQQFRRWIELSGRLS